MCSAWALSTTWYVGSVAFTKIRSEPLKRSLVGSMASVEAHPLRRHRRRAAGRLPARAGGGGSFTDVACSGV